MEERTQAQAGDLEAVRAPDPTRSRMPVQTTKRATTLRVPPTVGSENVGGVDCWVLTDKKGKSEGALYVSKDKSEVVRFTGSSDSPGQLDFSKWNEDLGIKAPEASQVM